MKTLAALALIVSSVALPLTAQAQALTIRVDTPHLGIQIGSPPPVPVFRPPVYPIVQPVPVYVAPRVVIPAPVYVPAPVYYVRPGRDYDYVPARYVGHGKHKYRHDHRYDRRHPRWDRYDN